MIDASLFTFLQTLVTPMVVQEGNISDLVPPGWVWFRRALSNRDTYLSGVQFSAYESFFDIEVVNQDIDIAQNTADTLKSELNGFFGAMGTDFVQGCWVEDHEDSYVMRSVFNDDAGFHSCAFQAHIFSVA
jgi:hypothetical protein